MYFHYVNIVKLFLHVLFDNYYRRWTMVLQSGLSVCQRYQKLGQTTPVKLCNGIRIPGFFDAMNENSTFVKGEVRTATVILQRVIEPLVVQ